MWGWSSRYEVGCVCVGGLDAVWGRWGRVVFDMGSPSASQLDPNGSQIRLGVLTPKWMAYFDVTGGGWSRGAPSPPFGGVLIEVVSEG